MRPAQIIPRYAPVSAAYGTCLCIAVFVAVFIPFRVMDCAPGDPATFHRYFGAPIIHQTGHSVVSSMEAIIWLPNLGINIGLLYVVCALLWYGLRKCIPYKIPLPIWVYPPIVVIQIGFIALTTTFVMDANQTRWHWGPSPNSLVFVIYKQCYGYLGLPENRKYFQYGAK
ncbi:MAG: hypothetical protein AAF701_06515 [Pseudomonadota bacterium]